MLGIGVVVDCVDEDDRCTVGVATSTGTYKNYRLEKEVEKGNINRVFESFSCM